MIESDPLRSILREWEAPEPSAELDARIRASYRAVHRPSPWRCLFTARLGVPVAVLGALMLVVAVVLVQFRSMPPEPRPVLRMESALVPLPGGGGYVTRLDATGLQPLPNGAARVVRSGELNQ